MPAQAPVLNKIAHSYPAQPASPPARDQAPPEQPPSPERQRIAAAVEFGAELEALVSYARLPEEESDAAPRAPGPRFPPDLLIRRVPEARLRSTYHKLLKLEPALLGLDQFDGPTSISVPRSPARPPSPNGPSTAAISQTPPRSSTEQRNGPSPLPRTSTPTEASIPTGAPALNGTSNPTISSSERSDEAAPPAEPSTPNGRPASAGPSTAAISQTPPRSSTEQPNGTAPSPRTSTPTEASIPAGAPALDDASNPAISSSERSAVEPSFPNGPPASAAAISQAPPRSSTGHSTPARPSAPAKPPASRRPSDELEIKQKIEAVLASSQDLGPALSELDDAICGWNDSIVELIVDSPAVLSGYRAGKALRMTRLKIWTARHYGSADGYWSVNPWEESFGKQRVDEIQRHVNSLSTVLDPQAVTAVSTSLGYWRNALLSLTPTQGSSSSRSWWRNALRGLASFGESSSSQPSSTIRVLPEHGEKLLTALEEQLTNWLDLLTGRRPPGSFPVAGIVTALTKKMAADLWSRLFRFLIPAVPFVLIVGALLVAGFLVYNALGKGLSTFDLKGLLGSAGTALVAVFTFMRTQARSLFGRGSGASWGGAGYEGTRPRGIPQGNYGLGAGAVAGLQQEVLSSVVDQIRLEELNLAVSEPLMRCVLTLNKSKKGDPLKDAERFLRLIHTDKSNLDRLRPIFKDLCKH